MGEFERLLELDPKETAVVTRFLVQLFTDCPVTREQMVHSMVQGDYPWFVVKEADDAVQE